VGPGRTARARLVIGLLVASGVLSACTRGPDEATLRRDLQARLDQDFKAGVLEVVGLNRQGSAPAPSADGQAARRLVYFNATMAFRDAYDFGAWEGLSPAVLATVLGATEKGLVGIKQGGNARGDWVRARGSALYEATPDGWRSVRTGLEAGAPRPPVPEGQGAAPLRARELLDTLASEVARIKEPEGPSGRIVEYELSRAVRDITLRLGQLDRVLNVAGGPPGGAYARFAEAVVGHLQRAGRRVQSVPTDGSVENCRLVGRGEAAFGIAQADVAGLALAGEGPFAADGAFTRLRTLGSLFPEAVHLLVLDRSPIRRVADLEGKRVDIGKPASGTRYDALAVLAAHGLGVKDLEEASQDGLARALERLERGEIDALVETTAAPAPAIQAMAARARVRLVPLEPAAAAQLAAAGSGRVRLTLPTNTYPDQTGPVPTVATAALLITTIDVPQGDVAALLRLVFEEGTDLVAQGSAAGARVSRQTARVGLTIPMHPEADRYFAVEEPAARPASSATASGSPR
ncbi:MAG TPA: TAXI family TRAP transporter solute-binding subunit, partial [Thermodesulfobacteriota bacterium]